MKTTTHPWIPRKLPKNWPYTAHRDGWTRWYKGRTVFVCGKGTPLEQVEDCWITKKQAVDEGSKVIASGLTIKLLCSQFMARQRRRMDTGRPTPLSARTFADYTRTLKEFATHVGVDKPCDHLGASDFESYARTFDGKAASSLARSVAYTKALFNWAAASGVMDRVAFGPDFKAPSAAVIRDQRIGKTKSYTAEEIRALWRHARREERLWMALGINGAMDNSDVSTLTWDLINWETGVIDFRRRKVGKVRRVIPLVPRVLRMLNEHRAAHSTGERIFSTPNGYALVRINTTGSAMKPIDFIALRWTRLMQRAGLRPKPTRDGSGERKTTWVASTDRRGFRSLRTTAANVFPAGYGDERNIVMGHSHGNTFLDNYLERLGVERIREAVSAVWVNAFTTPRLRGQVPKV